MTDEAQIATLSADVKHLSESINRMQGQLDVLIALVGRVSTLERDVNNVGVKVEAIDARTAALEKKWYAGTVVAGILGFFVKLLLDRYHGN
jgi:soluble P-type ATPase